MTAGNPSAAGEGEGLRAALLRAGLGSLEEAFAYGGGNDLVKPGLGHRRRTRLEVADEDGKLHGLYLKRYGNEPWPWRLRRWWTCGLRMSPAKIEARNIEAARQAGIATMQAVAFDQAPGLLQAGRSYLVVTAVPGKALSRCAGDFLRRHVGDRAAAELAVRLAELAGRMHRAGLVHRDFYAAHVFLREGGGSLETRQGATLKPAVGLGGLRGHPQAEKSPLEGGTHANVELYLIDLARMFRPARWRRLRWQVKDIAQLKFSLPGEFVASHWGAFMDEYVRQAGHPPGMLRRFERAVDRKAAWILARSRRNRKP